MPRSRFSLPEVVVVEAVYRAAETKPTAETVWMKPFRVPLSKRIADRAAWHLILEKL